MEIFYAFGITCIQIVQDRLREFEGMINSINHVFSPNYMMEYIFPMMCSYDSVFGAQILLCVAFSSWLITMLKWILVEDRPFWWVRETTFYSNADRPFIYQNIHTCETGPGSPSGHCTAAATFLMLVEIWISHIIRDMGSVRLAAIHKKMPVKTIYVSILSVISIARMFVAAHFPHQCILGCLIGSFVTPFLCMSVADPCLLRTPESPVDARRYITRHLAMACCAIALSMLLGLVYMATDLDIHWSTRQAFRWCLSTDYIAVKSAPMFSIVQSTGSLVGWALAVTPELAKYRHNSNRNPLVAAVAVLIMTYFFNHLQEYIPHRRVPFYTLHFLLSVVKPYVLLRLIPKLGIATHMGRVERSARQSRAAAVQARTTAAQARTTAAQARTTAAHARIMAAQARATAAQARTTAAQLVTSGGAKRE